ncbi:hypothetical protein KXR87_13030 [Yokenella regensburgei]|uniref:hypothetical protein n=1 Tax=Yokenella regensburgei TaxID=158877 RepID=UPI003F155CAA
MELTDSQLERIKFNADCAIEDPESIYASEFFLCLDEIFGKQGDYQTPVQAVALSALITEIMAHRAVGLRIKGE